MKVTKNLAHSGTFNWCILRGRMKPRKHAYWDGDEASTNGRGCEEEGGSVLRFNMSNRKGTS